MAYNIIQAHFYYDFPTFILNEVSKNLVNIEKSRFQHSSYLWWLIVHQNFEALVEVGLQIEQDILSIASTPIDLKVPMLTKTHGSYYEFMKKFFSPVMQILTGRVTHRLHRSIMEELQGGNNIGYQYFLKIHTIIIR